MNRYLGNTNEGQAPVKFGDIMTDLSKMSRRELLGLMVEAEELDDNKLYNAIMEEMTRQQTDYGAKAKQKRGFFTNKETTDG